MDLKLSFKYLFFFLSKASINLKRYLVFFGVCSASKSHTCEFSLNRLYCTNLLLSACALAEQNLPIDAYENYGAISDLFAS